MTDCTHPDVRALTHREKITFKFAADDVARSVGLRLTDGCDICWDLLSTVGDQHAAPQCPVLKKANAHRVLKGMSAIPMVGDTYGLINAGSRARMSLEARVSSLEQAHDAREWELASLKTKCARLESAKAALESSVAGLRQVQSGVVLSPPLRGVGRGSGRGGGRGSRGARGVAYY